MFMSIFHKQDTQVKHETCRRRMSNLKKQVDIDMAKDLKIYSLENECARVSSPKDAEINSILDHRGLKIIGMVAIPLFAWIGSYITNKTLTNADLQDLKEFKAKYEERLIKQDPKALDKLKLEMDSKYVHRDSYDLKTRGLSLKLRLLCKESKVCSKNYSLP